RTGHRIKNQFPAQPEPLHSRAERIEQGLIERLITAAAETFQPVNVAAQLAQTLRVLHIDPEVPAAFREIHDIKWRDYHAWHKPMGFKQSNQIVSPPLANVRNAKAFSRGRPSPGARPTNGSANKFSPRPAAAR